MALVVMGKRIAQQRVPNPQRAPKPAKRPTPTTKSMTAPPTMSTTADRPKPTGRNSPDYADIHQFVVQLAEEVWPTPPHLSHLTNRPPLHIWDRQTARRSGDPRAQGRTSPERDPPTVEVYAHTIARLDAEIAQTRQAATARYHARAIEQTDDEDDRPQTCRWSGSGPGHAP
jgi:hypothetical protein